MLWLLQNNHVDHMTSKLAWALQRTSRPVRDFSLTDEPLDFAALCAADAPHFFYGSTGMLRRVQNESAYAGALFGDAAALDQRNWIAHRGCQLLNAEVEFTTLASLQARVDSHTPAFFVRPALDQKAFTGFVVRNGNLEGVYASPKGRVREQPGGMLLAVSPVQEGIAAEYRFVVLDHRVRLGSRYRYLNRRGVTENVPQAVWDAANRLAAGWLPNRFVVMDVAVMADDRACIVEFNSVHSSGLYAIDPEAFIELVEEAVFPAGHA